MKREGRVTQPGAWGSTPQIFTSMDRNRDETKMNQYGYLTPTFCPETSLAELQQALQHIKFQIKKIRTGSITDPEAASTSLPNKDSFPKKKCSFRKALATLSENSPQKKGLTKLLQKNVSNSLLASNT